VSGRRQRQIRPSTDLVARLVAEYEGGATTYDLATRHGLHRNTITAHLRRVGVTIRMDGMTPEQIQQAADLYAEGWSLARVGRAVGADAETVRKRLREVGVACCPSLILQMMPSLVLPTIWV
jgi:lambda repressor-like predicted transcriptional regulator